MAITVPKHCEIQVLRVLFDFAKTAMVSHISGTIKTPIGDMLATVSVDNRLEKLDFMDKVATAADLDHTKLSRNAKHHPILRQVQLELNEYFAGQRQCFSVPLVDADHPLLSIPYGVVWTYQQLAEFIEKPKAFRYAGHICKVNNVSIIIPCHRVISKGGKVNYGGGPDRKIFLLDLEMKWSKHSMENLTESE
ncbi:methylated-DNA--protein-cysteine methyltransferase, constitutive [Phlebotomus argentipes]|uniref:methylated-DNA--protein-cysteine methyltransferase, constitutive n=1 Tax=Phlebotomus argentipes TaxID=94469 RepID=UPI00289368B8|nr:methylated-DNA--protein-cysteine methyltransferase, constitutive [Phlebotomus argentipes]